MPKAAQLMYQRTVLANGLRVLTVPMPQVRSVTVAVFLGAGSRYETPAEAGLSHFLEHMLFKGTQRRPLPQMISEAVEGVGGYMNASTDRELTIYWAKAGEHHMGTIMDLLADMLTGSRLDPTEFEREKKIIIEEINSINDSPQQRVDLLIDEVMWPGQPLGRDVAGTPETVSALSRGAMLAYRASQYAPNNAVIAICGNVEHEEVTHAVDQYFGAWQRTDPRNWLPSKNGHKSKRIGLHTQKTEQAHLCMAFPGLSSQHPDRYALDMLNVVLGEGMSSRLFVEIREKRGLAYEVHSYASHFADTGAMTVYAGVDPKNIDSAVEGILGEIGRLKESIPAAELHKAKEMTKGRLLLRTEDTRSMASWVGAQEVLRNEVKTVDDIVEIVDGITIATLHRVANEILAPERLKMAVVGPFRSTNRFHRLLA